MGPPLTFLLLFAAWTLVLVLAIAGARGARVLGGKARPEDFTAGVPHGGDRYWRLNRSPGSRSDS